MHRVRWTHCPLVQRGEPRKALQANVEGYQSYREGMLYFSHSTSYFSILFYILFFTLFYGTGKETSTTRNKSLDENEHVIRVQSRTQAKFGLEIFLLVTTRVTCSYSSNKFNSFSSQYLYFIFHFIFYFIFYFLYFIFYFIFYLLFYLLSFIFIPW